MMQTRGSSLPSIETRDLKSGKVFVVYRNGDSHFGGKKYVLNPRAVPNFDAFLDDVKKYVPNETAIRRVYTPSGGSRITDYSQLESDKIYVCAGKERFKRINYTQIESYSPRRKNRQSREERLVPAHHNKLLENVTGKINTVPIQGKAIEVFVNGQDIDKPTTVGLSSKQLESMTEVIKTIHEAIKEKHQYRVDQLCDLEGHILTDVKQIEAGGLYVAKNFYHKFQPGRYEPHGRKNIIVPLSPRDKLPTKYLWKERTLPPIQNNKKQSPDHSVSSYPETRKRNQVNGVPTKPAKHTKKAPKQADYDKDDGGVFKAKTQSKDTRGAREDEKIKKEKQGKDINSLPSKQTDHSHGKTMQNGDRSQGLLNGEQSHSKTSGNYSSQNTSVQNGKNSTYKSNSKAPPPDQSQNKANVKNNDNKNEAKKPDPQINNNKNEVKKPDPQINNTRNEVKPEPQGNNNMNEAKKPEPQNNSIKTEAKKPEPQNNSIKTEAKKPEPQNNNIKNEANKPETQGNNIKTEAKKPEPQNNNVKNEAKKPEPQDNTKNEAKKPEPQLNNTKNETTKQDPAKENKNQNNHDLVRASTPKDANKNAPPPKTTPSPSKDNKVPSPTEEHEAATKIQANFRGHQARKEVTDLKMKKEEEENQKKTEEQKAKQAKEENEAATKIQAGFRGHQARKEIQEIKQVRDVQNSKEETAATKIQAGFRGHQARKEIERKKLKRTEKNAEEEAAATKIQAGFRGHKARKEIENKKLVRDNKNKEEETAATKIQAGYRGYKARIEVNQKKKEKAQQEEEEKAATKIQAGFRGHQARKDIQKKKTKHLDGKVDAITVIQAAVRGFLVRRRIEKRESTKMLLKLRSAAQEEVMDILGLIHERDKAATVIQARYRGFKDRKEYKRVKVTQEKELSATFLQANIRAFLERKNINKRLLMEMRKVDTPVNRQGYSDSVDKVQASFHGYLLRKVTNTKLHQILIRKDAVTTLQASIRAYVERWHIRRRKLAALARYHNAASDIQMYFKSYLTRRRIEVDMQRRESSASKIQAGVRGYLARKGYLQTKQAVTRIQSGFRGYKARQEYEQMTKDRQNSAAVVVQSNFRGYKVRKTIQMETKHRALAQLQATIRGFIARREIMMKEKQLKETKIHEAAVRIQTRYRGFSERHKYEVTKRKRVNELRRISAATEIQAHFRGHLTRRKIHSTMKKRVHNTERFSYENTAPLLVQGTGVRFDIQTTGNISPVRPRTGRLQSSLSNVNREQTYVINDQYPNTNDSYHLRSMTRSTAAHVDSFSHLQESFRSLLSRRRKSSKPPQQIFHDKTRFNAVSHIQACFKGFLTRRLISRMCQYDRDQYSNITLPTPTPPSPRPVLKNPDDIRVSGSYEYPKPELQDRIMPFYDYNGEISTEVPNEIPPMVLYHRQHSDEIPPMVSYHRQHSEEEMQDIRSNENESRIPVQYILRKKSNISHAETTNDAIPVENSIPVQYLFRSRESTRHQTPGQTYRNNTLGHRYEEPSPILKEDTEIPNPVMTDRTRFEEPSPPIYSSSSPYPTYSRRRYGDVSIVDDVDSQEHGRKYKELSTLSENENSIFGNKRIREVRTSKDYEIISSTETSRRFEEPSPLASETEKPDIEYPSSPSDTVYDLPNPDKFVRNPSRVTQDSNDSALSIETFSRKLVNEIQSSALLKDEALLILQAAFKGFLLRNLSHSRRLQKLSKMNINDKTIFDETALPFLQAGFKGYLTQNRELSSPPEM